MVKNFAKDSANFIKAGAPMCSEKEFERRMNICRDCEHFTEKNQCGICGCLMTIKAGWKTAECADTPKRWEKLMEKDESDIAMERVRQVMEKSEPDFKHTKESMLIPGQKSEIQFREERRKHLNKLKGRK